MSESIVEIICLAGIGFCFTLLVLLLLTILISGVPATSQNSEFKEAFCEQQGFDEYKDGACIKLNDSTITFKKIHCEGLPQFGFIIFDGIFEKITKCRVVVE